MSDNHIEAWKAVTEFTKVIASLSISILTILIGYITLNKIELSFANVVAPLFLVIAIVLSLFGFGRAIPAIKSGEQNVGSILFSNLSVLSLVIGIITIPLISTKQPPALQLPLPSDCKPCLEAPKKTDAHRYKVIAQKGLNVRVNPSIHSDIVKILSKGEIIIAISINNDWVKVDTNGDGEPEGFCLKKYFVEIDN